MTRPLKLENQLRTERLIVMLTKSEKRLLQKICFDERVACSTAVQKLIETFLKKYVDG